MEINLFLFILILIKSYIYPPKSLKPKSLKNKSLKEDDIKKSIDKNEGKIKIGASFS